MQWWCVAQERPWSWSWQPYPGVWIFLLLLTAAYMWALRRVPDDPGGPGSNSGRTRTWFALAVAVLLIALDWPLGALGASYLASIHMIQFLLIGIVAPALLLLSVPPDAYALLKDVPRVLRVVDGVTQPIVAFFIFNVGMTVTHWPEVTDWLMASQLGSFTLDMTWLLCGVVLWWPVIAPVPARPGFHPMLQILYLAVNAVIIRPPFLMLIFSKFPIYSTYELAPPIPGTDPLGDQQVAGGIMKVGSAWILIAAVVVVFFRWVRASQAEERAQRANV
jgi:putative membrane protein